MSDLLIFHLDFDTTGAGQQPRLNKQKYKYLTPKLVCIAKRKLYRYLAEAVINIKFMKVFSIFIFIKNYFSSNYKANARKIRWWLTDRGEKYECKLHYLFPLENPGLEVFKYESWGKLLIAGEMIFRWYSSKCCSISVRQFIIK